MSGPAWVAEAEAACAELRGHVRAARARGPDAGGGGALIDLTTLEGAHFRVRLSASGYRVLPESDAAAATAPPAYETPYALLGAISPRYRDSFGGELMSRLLDLATKTDP